MSSPTRRSVTSSHGTANATLASTSVGWCAPRYRRAKATPTITAAAVCLYGAIAALVLRGTRAWWRWAVLAVAVAVIVGVAFARLYRGAHHPTDVLASVAFAVPWLLVTLRLVGDDTGVRARPAGRPEPVGGTR